MLAQPVGSPYLPHGAQRREGENTHTHTSSRRTTIGHVVLFFASATGPQTVCEVHRHTVCALSLKSQPTTGAVIKDCSCLFTNWGFSLQVAVEGVVRWMATAKTSIRLRSDLASEKARRMLATSLSIISCRTDWRPRPSWPLSHGVVARLIDMGLQVGAVSKGKVITALYTKEVN